jgi:cytochrome c
MPTEVLVLHRLPVVTTLILAGIAPATHARAADVGRGHRLADGQCASCHKVAPPGRGEVADAPPFEVIARKFGFDADAIAHAIAGPHPKMNFSPRPDQAADIAAYIATLKR